MENIIVQISEEQHLSEERVIIGVKNADNSIDTKIVNISSFTEEELAIYNSFKTLMSNKLL